MATKNISRPDLLKSLTIGVTAGSVLSMIPVEAAEHAHKLSDMFSLVRVHYRAVAMFQCPTRPTGFQHDRVSAQLINPDLHRRARAQTGIEEDQRDRASRQRLGLIVAVFELSS